MFKALQTGSELAFCLHTSMLCVMTGMDKGTPGRLKEGTWTGKCLECEAQPPACLVMPAYVLLEWSCMGMSRHSPGKKCCSLVPLTLDLCNAIVYPVSQRSTCQQLPRFDSFPWLPPSHLKPIAFLFCHAEILEACMHLIWILHAVHRLVIHGLA